MDKILKPLKPSSVSVGVIEFGSLAWVGEQLVDISNYVPSYPQIWLSIEFGEFCPLNCVHCAWRKQVSRDVLSIDELLRILDDYFRSEYRPSMISISGKEPSVTKRETLRIAELAKQYGIKVVMMTSGIGFTKDFIRDTRGLIDYLDLSIDGDEKHHELIRGKGMFKRSLRALDIALEYGQFEIIGIISIASSLNYDGIGNLVRILDEKYPNTTNLKHTIGMYHGLPGESLLLNFRNVLDLYKSIRKLERPKNKPPVLFLFYPNYTYFLADFLEKVGVNIDSAKVCEKSGFLVIEDRNLQLIPLNHNKGILIIPRISSDGFLFMSSNHLVIPEKSSKYAIGDALKEPISDIIKNFYSTFKTSEYDFSPLTKDPDYCVNNCEKYPICGGGDRLLGLFLGDSDAYDPFCPYLREKKLLFLANEEE